EEATGFLAQRRASGAGMDRPLGVLGRRRRGGRVAQPQRRQFSIAIGHAEIVLLRSNGTLTWPDPYGRDGPGRYPAASARRRPPRDQIAKAIGRTIPRAKARPITVGSPEMKPRAASSSAVTGLTEATAWIQPLSSESGT